MTTATCAEELGRALIEDGAAVLVLAPDAASSLATAAAGVYAVWAREDRTTALQPLQPLPECGHVQLPGRQMLSYRAGPALWRGASHAHLRAAMCTLDDAASVALAALGRSGHVSVPPHGLTSLLDPRPVLPGEWSSSRLQAFSYESTAAEGSACEAHEDGSLLTVIYASDQPGLEVLSPATGRWTPVEHAAGQVVLLPGHSLEHALCGLVRAAQHRVALPPGAPSGRRSLVYKLHPRPDAVIHLRPGLQAAGMPPVAAGGAAAAYKQPITGAELAAWFEATHRSANAPAPAAGAGAASPSAAVRAEPEPQQVQQDQQVRQAQAEQQTLQQSRRRGRQTRPHGDVCVASLPVAKRLRQAPAMAAAPPLADVTSAPAARAALPEAANPPPAPLPAAPPATLKIHISDEAGNRVTFNVKRSTQLFAVFRACCAKLRLDESKVYFLFDGARLDGDTVGQAGLEDGDIIDLLKRQYGD
eukprot:scaffold2.g7374.t1